MNKKLKEATKQEIAQAYKDKVPLVISNYRKASLVRDIDLENGVVDSYCRFNLKMAESYFKGFDYRIWKSNKDRKARLKERVEKMVLSNRSIFVTLTFNDTFFARKTSEDTRRRYIRRFLKEQCAEYIANVDYGESEEGTHREHYHALVIPKGARVDFAPYYAFFDRSFVGFERVIANTQSRDSISRYISKLTNHALKSSGQYKRLIYSRGL